ncbi:uncharacterized protein PAC_16060 [Phialocephala subalpina]|uniref:Uncharacterized protein n=1 Tax=Phialocephala subalpina TaxID=576137 RepID=A0A1L7XMA3_9HELO|nr:uncharacterized protein PAC_16060 [Phialocephala subalpina]
MAPPSNGSGSDIQPADNREMMDESNQTNNGEQTPKVPRRHRTFLSQLLSPLKHVVFGKTRDKRKKKSYDKKKKTRKPSTTTPTLPPSALVPYYSVRELIDHRIKTKIHTEAFILSNGDATLQIEVENEKNVRYEKATSWAECISHMVPFSPLLTGGLRKCYIEAMIWYMMCGQERFPGDDTIMSEFSKWYYTEVEEPDLRVQFEKTLENFNNRENACREILVMRNESFKVTMQEVEREDGSREILVTQRESMKVTIEERKTIKVRMAIDNEPVMSMGISGWRVLMEAFAQLAMKLVDTGLD